MKPAIVDNDRNKLITTLTENLQRLETKFGSHFRVDDKVSPWGMVWMLMVGSLYSLSQANPLLENSRKPEDQLAATSSLLNQIKNLTVVDEGACGSWAVGYHLYSAEQRISSALDRLVEHYAPGKKSVFKRL